MPIVFIVSGFFFLAIIFDFIRFDKLWIKYLSVAYLFSLCISYFISPYNFGDISFNLMQSILIVLLYVCSFIKCKRKLFLFLISIVYSFAYFVLIKTNVISAYNFSSNNLCAFMIGVCGGLLCTNIYNGLFICIGSITCMSIIGVSVELELYTFAYLNLNFCFLVIVVYLGLQYLRTFIVHNLKISRRDNFYNDKEFISKTISNSYISSL